MADVSCRYSFDTNVIINPRIRQYPPDLFPAFWRDIEDLVRTGLAVCIEEVLHEVAGKGDDVEQWLADRAYMVVTMDAAIEAAYVQIINQFTGYAKRSGRKDQADPFVIALAKAWGLAVVTDETSNPQSGRPKIPDVCKSLGIECIDIIGLIRKEGWSY